MGLCGNFNQDKNDDFILFGTSDSLEKTNDQTWSAFKTDAEYRVAKSWLLAPKQNLRRLATLTVMSTDGQLPEIVVPEPDEGPEPQEILDKIAECQGKISS